MNDERKAMIQKALEHWKSLPEDERTGERPFIMGFNAGWEEREAQGLYELLAEYSDAILVAFNGGIVRVPDTSNRRGFTDRYLPKIAMRNAIAKAFEVEQ